MSDPVDPVADPDGVIQAASPALWAALSPLGRRLRQSEFLPLQTAQARGKLFNGTIGQITDGRGGAVPLAPMAAALGGLDPAERNTAFLYSPVEGFAPLRRLWRERQRRGQPPERQSSLPFVTMGPAHALALAAELFAGAGRAVLMPEAALTPADRELFEMRLEARLTPIPTIAGGHFDPTAKARALARLPNGEPALVVLRSPPRPGGYVPVSKERAAIRESLVQAAERRPIVVLADDTWERMDHERSSSFFWSLNGRHPNLVPVKVDGADGELGFPGGRVGFLTFPFDPETPAAVALESKVLMLSRAEVGSPSATGQVVVYRSHSSIRARSSVD